MQQLKSIYQRNRSFYPTSTKFGTRVLWNLLSQKSTKSTWKKQNGCHFSRWPPKKKAFCGGSGQPSIWPTRNRALDSLWGCGTRVSNLKSVGQTVLELHGLQTYIRAQTLSIYSEQITETTVHLMAQAPNLAHKCFGTFSLREVRGPLEKNKMDTIFQDGHHSWWF